MDDNGIWTCRKPKYAVIVLVEHGQSGENEAGGPITVKYLINC